MEQELREEGRLPGEVVIVYRRPQPREVVEQYTRPLPARMIPPKEPKKRRKRRGLVIFLLCLGVAAALALAALVPEEELNENNIMPQAFDPRVGPAVAKAVAEAARRTGVARI